ncbi:MAG: hypothetical protein IKC47_03570 [Clostridia bacterium]|nr:hypothetical protein [Clostridia bacterium]
MRKEILYSNLLQFCQKFSANVSTKKLVLHQFLQEFFCDASYEFALYSRHFVDGAPCKKKLLSKIEYQYAKRFFDGLNAATHQELVAHLDYYCDYFENTLNAVRADNKSKGRLGQKLGLLCGVIVGLVLI